MQKSEEGITTELLPSTVRTLYTTHPQTFLVGRIWNLEDSKP